VQAKLIRVGLDKGTGGALAPILDDRRFEYIPIPEGGDYPTVEMRTYEDIEGAIGDTLEEHAPGDFVDKHPHLDPEFESCTYGDCTSKRNSLNRLETDDLLIFYAGLQPHDYPDHPRLYVIGYLTVSDVHDLAEMTPEERAETMGEFGHNAHSKRVELTPNSKHPEADYFPLIVEGDPERSELLDQALPLSNARVPGMDADPYTRYEMPEVTAEITGYSSDKDLTMSTVRTLGGDYDTIRSWLDGNNPEPTTDSTLHTYVITVDTGFAPNPNGGYCTLATCKPVIRKNAEPGDWVIATGSTGFGPKERLVYAMRVEEAISYDEYFAQDRFERRKPLPHDGYDQHGDNIYYTDESIRGEQAALDIDDGHTYYETQHQGTRRYFTEASSFVQLDNPHHDAGEMYNDTRFKPNREAVLVSTDYYYFGEKEVILPENEEMRNQLIKGYTDRDADIRTGEDEIENEPTIKQFVDWLRENYRPGVHGDPIHSDTEREFETHTDCS
jgi:hypothetical protein